MKKKLIGIFVCMLVISCSTTVIAFTPFSSSEQQPNDQFLNSTPVPLPWPKRWMKTFGGTREDRGSSVQQTTDGGYIIVGMTQSFGSGNDVWLIKTDGDGNVVWNRTFEGGTGYSVEQTTDDGYIITGGTYSFGAGSSDVWLLKTDDQGYEEWNRTFGGTGDDMGNSVQQTADGGYIITGYTTFVAGFTEMWLIKTNGNGNKVWDKIFGGGGWRDQGSSVEQTTDGGYIIAGSKKTPFIPGYDVWLIKTDGDGEKVWERVFGRTNGDDWGSCVHQTRDGGYIIVGSRSFMAGTDYRWLNNHDIWLIKTNRRGIKVWDKTFGRIGGDDYGFSVQQTTDGGYIIAGSKGSPFRYEYYSYVWLIKTNRHGKLVWDRTFKGIIGLFHYKEGGFSVQQTTDGGYIITGVKGTNDPTEFIGHYNDVWLIKTNSHGKIKPLSFVYLWFENLFQRFPNAFPILRQLLGN